MTDPAQSPDLALDPDGDLFVVAPTQAWSHSIEVRLIALETAELAEVAPSVATLSPEQEQQILTALQGIDGRLSRQRAEIEGLKTHFNDLLNYVIQSVPVPASGKTAPGPLAAGTDAPAVAQ